MGVVSEDVFPGGFERGGSVKASGEVGGEEGPDGEGAEEGRAVGEFPRVRSWGEEDVDCIREKEGPEERDGAEKEESGEEEGDAESVGENHQGLEASLERNGYRGEVNTRVNQIRL